MEVLYDGTATASISQNLNLLEISLVSPTAEVSEMDRSYFENFAISTIFTPPAQKNVGGIFQVKFR